MNPKLFLASAALCASVMATSAQAGPVVMNFDTITTRATVDSYYNGGTDGFGEIGPNFGVTFTPGDWVTATGYGETSQPNFAFSISGAGQVDVSPGFTSLSFTYGGFSDTTIDIYGGLNGTGALLASVVAPADNPFAFSPFSVPFAGVAHSIVISGLHAQFGWDDVTINESTVPEPATWAMVIASLGAVGFAVRRNRTSDVAAK